jgi:hypothetical protein
MQERRVVTKPVTLVGRLAIAVADAVGQFLVTS